MPAILQPAIMTASTRQERYLVNAQGVDKPKTAMIGSIFS
jgi:hypothetical protein